METFKAIVAVAYYLLPIIFLVNGALNYKKAPQGRGRSDKGAKPAPGGRLYWFAAAYLLLGAALTGLFWKGAADSKAQTEPTKGEMWIDSPPTNLIDGKTFKNETVFLDGNIYRNCQFYFVTFNYQGRRPFLLEHNNIYQPCKVHGAASVSETLLLLHMLGAVNTNIFDLKDFSQLNRPPARSPDNSRN